MRSEFLVFGSPKIEQSEIDAVVKVMESAWLGTGPRTAEFEHAFAAYKGARHAAALNSCTAALHLACSRPGSAPGTRSSPPRSPSAPRPTRSSTPAATPVLADIDPAHHEHRPGRGRGSDHAAHAGDPAGPLRRPARATWTPSRRSPHAHGLTVIEDCAHAIESRVSAARRSGTLGDFTCFSFYATKNITTGEGGMVADRRRGLAPSASRSWRCTA